MTDAQRVSAPPTPTHEDVEADAGGGQARPAGILASRLPRGPGRPVVPPARPTSLVGGEAGGEAAGGDGTPAVYVEADQRLVLAAHGLAVLVPVGVLAGDAPVVLDETVERLGHVEHLRAAVD